MNKFENNRDEIEALIQEKQNENSDTLEIAETLQEAFNISQATAYRWIRQVGNGKELPDTFKARVKVDSFKLYVMEEIEKTLLKVRHKDDPKDILETLDMAASIICKLKKA